MSTPHTILNAPLTYLKGVGDRRAKLLESDLGLRTYGDLIEYFPYRYIDRTRIYLSTELHDQMPYVQLQGVIRGVQEEGSGHRRRLKAFLQDSAGVVELVWFKSVDYFKGRLHLGQEYIVFGKPTLFNGTFSISHPELELKGAPHSSVGMLYPMYHTSERMKKARIASKEISQLVRTVLREALDAVPETLPNYITGHYDMLPKREAIRAMHFPNDTRELERARLRLKTEELFYLRMKMLALKAGRRQQTGGYVFSKVGEHFHRLYDEGLPFELTGAQKRVLREIHTDVQSGHQMNRLLQGDVGSGKTAVAVLSMLLAVDNGKQACIMAPTEILAQQHYKAITKLLHGQTVSVALLTGSMKKSEKDNVTARLIAGEIDILVGTHILIQDYVRFRDLGLAVIDEQHRFGVYQRSVLWDKSRHYSPHILIMSATPIPRTLALTMYGDLDVSILDELPPGRTPIVTQHAFEHQRSDLYFFIRDQLRQGRQAYVVYPLIEESENLDYRSVEEGFENIRNAFPATWVGMVHGRLPADEKEKVMQDFADGTIRILVATTVIEVGVDVPNASIMLIESAERFGLSQLHQLRGRVGRGTAQSYCILMTGEDFSENSMKRIRIMCESSDGFYIAEEDLKLRGYGDMEGTAQSGDSTLLKVANLSEDSRIVAFVSNLSGHILQEDPTLSQPQNALIRQQLSLLLEGEKDWLQIS